MTIIKAKEVGTIEKLVPIFARYLFCKIISAAGIYAFPVSPPELIKFLTA
jgi:hypothetical protein